MKKYLFISLAIASLVGSSFAQMSAGEASAVVFKEGDALFKAGRYEEALAKFRRSNEIAESSGAHIMTGITLTRLKRFSDAIPPLRQTIKMVPTNPEAHYWLSYALFMDKQAAAAEPEAREAIRYKPGYQAAWFILGNILFAQNKFAAAADAFEWAVKLADASGQRDTYAMLSLGSAYNRLNRREDAMRIQRSLAAIDAKLGQQLLDLINKPPNASPAPAGNSQADALVAEGNKHFQAKNYTKAIEAYTQAIALKPSSSTYSRLGNAYYSLQKYQDAVAAYKKAIELDPKSEIGHYNLGTGYDALGQYENAIASYRESLRIKPDYVPAHNRLGIVYYDLDKFSDALPFFTEAVRLSPNDPQCLANLGDTYVDLRRDKEARQIVTRLKRLDQEKAEALADDITLYFDTMKSATVFLAAAEMFNVQKAYLDVIRTLHHALILNELEPDKVAAARSLRGAAFIGLNKPDRAIAEFREAVRLAPRDAGYQEALGNAYIVTGQKAQAQQVYQKLVALDKPKAQKLLEAINTMAGTKAIAPAKAATPKATPVKTAAKPAAAPASQAADGEADELRKAGDKFYDNGDHARAEEAYRKSIAIRPSALGYNGLGNALSGLKKYNESVTAYRQAMKLKPGDPILHANLAESLHSLHRYEDAALEYRESLRLNPNSVEAQNSLGTTLFRLGRYAEAVIEFQTAMRLDPKNAMVRRNMVKTYVEMRRRAEAEAANAELRKLDQKLATEMDDDINDYFDPPRSEGHLEAGFEALKDLEEYEHARRHFHHAFLLKPHPQDLPLANYGMASALYWLGDNTRALTYIREAIRLDAKDARYPALLGAIYVEIGNKLKAQQVYAKLNAMDKKLAAELLESIKKMK